MVLKHFKHLGLGQVGRQLAEIDCCRGAVFGGRGHQPLHVFKTEGGKGLWHTVFENLEVLLFQVVNRVSFFIPHAHIHQHQVGLGAQEKAAGVLRGLRCGQLAKFLGCLLAEQKAASTSQQPERGQKGESRMPGFAIMPQIPRAAVSALLRFLK